MKHQYKTAALIGIFLCEALTSHGQTHYGSPVGTVGDGHAFFGVQAGASNQAAQNTFLGSYAGQFHSSGGKNTFLGFQSGQGHSGGGNNTFLGAAAGKSSLGENNVMLGSSSGEFLSANNNTFLGTFSGQNHKAGANNTFVGQMSGQNHNGGDDNVFLGSYAGKSSAGATNVFLGNKTGEVFNGNKNVLLGHGTGYNGSGDNNVMIGWASGSTAKGDKNVLIGSWTSGYDLNAVSSKNTIVGAEAGLYNKNTTDNAFFGADAGYLNKTGSYNTMIGQGTGYQNETGKYNTFLGYVAGSLNSTGDYNTYVGAMAGGGATQKYATAIGSSAKVTKDHSIVLGTGTDFVGVGVSAPAYQLQLSGSAAAKAGSSSWIVASDKRLKKDISEYKEGLDLLKQIKPVWFSYNGDAGMPLDKKFVGIIAQDMQKIAPHMVGTFTYQDSLGNKTEYLDYDANAMTYMLVNAVKEQQQMLDQKDDEIRQLTAETAELTKRLTQLERIVAANMTRPLTNPAARTNDVNENGVILEQNSPNGFSGTSSIRFFIPETIKEAVLNIYSTGGQKIRTEVVKTRGDGSIQLSADDFGTGVFVYDLVTDGKSNGAKKMMVSK